MLNSKNLEDGAIILFHNNAKYTKTTLDTILTGLEKKGFEIVPISSLILKEDYYMDHTGKQISEK